jgi:hypothetical protein
VNNPFSTEPYPDNLCGGSWLRKTFFPYAWCRAENRARRIEYRLRRIEAKLFAKKIPLMPGRIEMR